MATIVGAAGLTWGITAETSGVAQTFNEAISSDKSEIKDIAGDIVGLSYHGLKTSSTLVVLSSSNPSQKPGDKITVANSSITQPFYVDNVSVQKINEGFQTAVFNAVCYPSIK